MLDSIRDCSLMIAQETLNVVAPCLRPEEQRDAFAEFYRIVKAGIESLLIQRSRELRRRADPSNN